MAKYTFYWLTGKREVLEGTTPEEALNLAGFGQGAIPALDFWATEDNKDYIWNPDKHEWDMTPEYQKKMFS